MGAQGEGLIRVVEGQVRLIFGVAFGFGIQAEGVNAVPESQFVVLSPGHRSAWSQRGSSSVVVKAVAYLALGSGWWTWSRSIINKVGTGWGTPGYLDLFFRHRVPWLDP